MPLLSITLLCLFPGSDILDRVHEFRLRNGLHCIVYVDSAAPVVSVNVYYKVGSYHEPPGKSGLSHMLEHMTFKRSNIYRPGDFDRILDSVGANNNGFTSTYYTGYYEDFASDRWELGMKLEAARMGRCLFPDADFESEHQVVWEERRLLDNRPQSVFWEHVDATVFLANPQRNPTIGWSDDVARFSVEDVREWYQNHYHPANAVLVIAGAVDPADVKQKANRYFGPLKGRTTKELNAYSIEPEQLGERRVTVYRRVAQPMLVIAFHSPGYRDSLYVTADIAAGILGRGRNSRLYRRLVTETGLCSWVGCWNSAERDPGALYILTQPHAESLIPTVEELVYKEIASLRDSLVSQYEIARVRNGVLAERVFNREDVSDMAYFLATHQITKGDWRAFHRYPQLLDSVTPERVHNFVRGYLASEKSTVGLLLPSRKRE